MRYDACCMIRFVPVNRERLDIFALATGKKLLTPNEQSAQAQATTERADDAEAKLVEALARIRELEARAE